MGSFSTLGMVRVTKLSELDDLTWDSWPAVADLATALNTRAVDEGHKMKDHIVIDHELIFVCHVLGIKEGIESYTIEDEPAILEEVCNQVGEEVKDKFSQLKNKIREYDTEAHNTLMNLIIKSLS